MARIPFSNEVSGTLKVQSMPGQSSGVNLEMVSAETGFGETIGASLDAIEKYAVQRKGKLDLEEYEGTMAAYKTWELGRKRDAYGKKMHDAKNIFASEKLAMDDWASGDGTASHLAFKEKYDKMSDRQKSRISTAITVRSPDYLNAIGIHQDQQTDAALVDSSKSSIGASITNYAAAATEEESRRELNSVDSSIDAIGFVKGWDAKRIADEKLIQRSTAHESRIVVMLSAEGLDPNSDVVLEAKEYVQKFKGELTKASLVTVNKAVREADVDLTSDLKTKEISNGGQDWVVELGKIKDTDVRDATRTKLYQLERLKNHAGSEARRQAETTIYDHIISKRGRSKNLRPMDFQKLGPELQSLYNSLSAGSKKALASIRDEQIYGEKKVPDGINNMSYQRLARLQFTQPEKFKKLNIYLKFHGQLEGAHIRHFADIQAKMFEGKMTETKDRLSNFFDKAGWTGADNAPRRGQVRIDVQSAVDRFEGTHDGRSPDDKEMARIIQARMGSASYITGVEKDNPIVGTPPKPMAGMSATQRGTFYLGVNKITKKDQPDDYFKAMTAIDSQIESLKAQNQGQISEKQEINIARRVASDKVYVDGTKQLDSIGIGTDDHKLLTSLPEDTDQTKIYVLVGEEMIFLKDLVRMSEPDRKYVYKEIARMGVADTMQNIASIWRGRQDLGQFRTITVPNPDGDETTTTHALDSMSDGMSRNEMVSTAPDIKKKYGWVAEGKWLMEAESKEWDAKLEEAMQTVKKSRKSIQNLNQGK